MKRNFISFALLVLCPLLYSSQTPSKETLVIETVYGKMKIKLFEETPLHKANFLKLVKEGVFDSLLFHRVINLFMIQGGDPLSKRAGPGDSLGHGDLGYTIPAEFNEKLIHKKGRLCAARENDDINPLMASSASQFYLVMGRKRTPEELKKYEERINKARYVRCARAFLATDKGRNLKQQYNHYKSSALADSAALINTEIEANVMAEYANQEEYKFSAYQTETYTTIGGTPHLDGSYTVFGEVVEGIDIIDKIAAVKTDQRDRPLEDIRMKIYLMNE
jgi:cyclophilin family peptidyl-prolyl cis-trans isomerase